MLFSLSTVLLAAASLAIGSAIEKREVATCTYIATPDVTPKPYPLFSEWNYLIGVHFARTLPSGTLTDGSNSTVAGPNASGSYTIVRAIGTDGYTAADIVDVVTGWVGETWDGPWSEVQWHIDNVIC
ncbi:hypothetical protein NMY22_g5514 [Coprinellus aureogranulatus]|nr:hypothetical protein NMY22_g5514 [Coprinellus aureogranulatus]